MSISSRQIKALTSTSIPVRAQPARLVAPQSLRPSLRNARTHSQKQIRQISDSIKRFGWTYPLIADEAGNVICGHGRLAAAQSLGLSEVPVIHLEGLSETEKRALALADNKIAANAGWDRKKLAAELGELAALLPEIDLSLETIGFEAAEFDGLVADLGSADEPSDALPDVGSLPTSRPGDLWRLGPHLILCGDSGREADVATLFGLDRASMVFTDPPYNVRISNVVGRGKRKHREFLAGSGELSPREFTQFLTRSLSLSTRFAKPGALCYSCMDWRHMQEVLEAGKQGLGELLNLVVWVKNSPGQGSFYRSQHELIFIYRFGDAPHQNNIQLGRLGRNRSNVWDYPRVDTFRTGAQAELTLHPTVKPLALVADAILDCTRHDDIVFDPFLGSGTTIVAAEKVGRRGYGIEIDPLYVDVAIRRWQGFTKSDAILVRTGQTFDDLAAGACRRVRKAS